MDLHANAEASAQRRQRGVPARAAAAGAAVLLVLVPALATGEPGTGENDPAPPRPNLILITTDDQSASTLTRKFMPHTFQKLVRPGTRFENFAATTPICCPSRAGFYTGQYSHNNNVFLNRPGYDDLRDKDNVLPVWLRRAGYSTALVGKFMHGYAESVDKPATPAPGYTDWHALLANDYYRYRMSHDGVAKRHGGDPKDYVTTVITRRSVKLIRGYAEREAPFFMHISQIAPHSDRTKGSVCDHAAMPAPRDLGRYSRRLFDEPQSFGEHDVSDKPSFIQRLRRVRPGERNALARKYRCRAASLRQVDRGVKKVVRTLSRAGELGETVIALSGDNGYFLGEHRLRRGKGLPYEEAIVQPLVMRVPDAYVERPSPVDRVRKMTANIDIAPTFLELAGAEPCTGEGCRTLDGRSLVPLLEGEDGGFKGRGVLVEYRAGRDKETRDKDEGGSCEYAGIRTARTLYVEYTMVFDHDPKKCKPAREFEHYDLEGDRAEVHNLFPPSSDDLKADQARLAERVEALRRCEGSGQRDDGPPTCE
jgi:arylsulfatase A-like enzyme